MALADGLRLQVNALDFTLLIGYFCIVIGIGLAARRAIATSEDFFLSGRSLPGWITGLAFISAAHLFNGPSFAAAGVLIAGVNLYALAIVIQALLGWPLWVAIVVAGAVVLVYITLGGLSGAIYNEVLQFFVVVAGLVPLVVGGHVGGSSHQPPRRLDRDRFRPGLRTVVRVLDDELRRGTARASRA